MLSFYKRHIKFITDHAVDPDKRRNIVRNEGAHHYIDIDYYGPYPYTELPRKWDEAKTKYSVDTLNKNGILPWHIQIVLARLTKAFKDKDFIKILKNSADIGHYIADAHVPLHTSKNHNGQLTDQVGIHAFWESRIPELLADKHFNFFIGKAEYLKYPAEFMWARVLESAKAADSVLLFERELSKEFKPRKKYAFEQRNKIIMKQYSSAYTIAYNTRLNGMVERRMRQAIFSVASFWYTAWVNAGQPNLDDVADNKISPADMKEFEDLNILWKNGRTLGREHE